MKNKKFKKALKTKQNVIRFQFHRINHSNMPITQATLANATLNCTADAVSCYDLGFLKGLRNLSTVSRTLVKLIPLFLPNILSKASVGPLSRNNFSRVFCSHRKQPTLRDFLATWRLRNECWNSVLTTCDYPDLGSVSDWSCHEWNFLQPIRSNSQI